MVKHRFIRQLILSLLLMTVLVVVIHTAAERTVIDEVRTLLAGVAATTAEGLMSQQDFGRDFQFIDGTLDPLDPGDPRHEAFYRIAAHLDRVHDRFSSDSGSAQSLVPRISYIYTLRRVRPTDPVHPAVRDEDGDLLDITEGWQYVVDSEWYAHGRAGVPPGLIRRDVTEDPSLHLHDTLELALQGATASQGFHRDEGGRWLSGFAPLYDASGTPIGVLGVDLNRRDLGETLVKIRLVSLSAWLGFAGLIVLVFHTAGGRVRAFEELQRLDEQLQRQNEELTQTNASLEEANREFGRQIELAKRIQQNFLPTDFPRTNEIAFGSIYFACEAVGGDIYDVFVLDEQHIGLYIADVSGHGISAALIGATLKMSVEAMKTAVSASGSKRASILYRPRDMIIRLHNILSENLSREHFITMQYAVVSTDSMTIRLCNAGHTWPVWWHAAEGRAELVETNSGLPIGYVVEDVLVEQEYQMTAGDKLVLYTDGLTETAHRDNQDDLFGDERLAQVVDDHGASNAQALVESIKQATDEFAGGKPSNDDVALIVIEMLEGERQQIRRSA